MKELKLELKKLSPKENDIIMVKLSDSRILSLGEMENLKDISKALEKRNVTLLVVDEEPNFELCSKNDLEQLKVKIESALANV